MNDHELRAHYQSAMAHRSPEHGCPEPETLVAVAAQQATGPTRDAVLDHITQCAACKQELDLLLTLRAVQKSERRTAFPQRWAIAASLLAAIGVGTIVIKQQWDRSRPTDSSTELVRGVPIAQPGLAIDSLSLPVTLAWPKQNAVTYVVELLDGDGRSRYSASTSDSSLTLPDSLNLRTGRDYDWWVRARQIDGKEIAMPFRRLTVIER